MHVDDDLITFLADSQGLAGTNQAPHLLRLLLSRDTSVHTEIHRHARVIHTAKAHTGPLTLQTLRTWHALLLGADHPQATLFRHEPPPRWPWPVPSITQCPRALVQLLMDLEEQLPQVRPAPQADRAMFAWWYHHRFLWLLPFQAANGRIARLILNVIRQRLLLPWITISPRDSGAYRHAIISYAAHRALGLPCCCRRPLIHHVDAPSGTLLHG